MLAVLLATTMLFETPTFRADTLNPCFEHDLSAPLSGFIVAKLYGTKHHERAPRFLASKSVAVGGFTDSLTFADSGAVWTVWHTFTDALGYESCPGNLVTVNATASVLPVLPEPEWTVYDVAGRIVASGGLEPARRTLPAGFYVARRGRECRALVVRR
jgi:hypothetical protein